jgi:deoxyadenosine/deoxycytidine kinase
MDLSLRIALAGPSGTGKSTLAKWISEEYKIPFITTSTKPLWDKHKIKSHLMLLERASHDPVWGLQFQHEVLEFRENALKGHVNFVTDRSPVDNLSYFLLQNTHSLPENDTTRYIHYCEKALSKFNYLFVLPFTKEIPLEDDGKRINNRYYQMLSNQAFDLSCTLMVNELKKLRGNTLQKWDWETRKQLVKLTISKEYEQK